MSCLQHDDPRITSVGWPEQEPCTCDRKLTYTELTGLPEAIRVGKYHVGAGFRGNQFVGIVWNGHIPRKYCGCLHDSMEAAMQCAVPIAKAMPDPQPWRHQPVLNVNDFDREDVHAYPEQIQRWEDAELRESFTVPAGDEL